MRTKLSDRDCTFSRQKSVWRGWRRIGFLEEGFVPGSRWAYFDLPRESPKLFANKRDALDYLIEHSKQVISYARTTYAAGVGAVSFERMEPHPFICTLCEADATPTDEGAYMHRCTPQAVPA